MFHIKHHAKKHGQRVLAATLMIALIAVAIQFQPSQFNIAYAAGSAQWGSNLELSTLPLHKEQTNVVKTSGGNYIAVWQYGDNGPFDMYAAKFDNSGTELWTSEYQINSAGDQLLDPNPIKLVADNEDHAFFGYIDENNHVVVQRLSTSAGGGALACGWSDPGLDMDYLTMNMVPDGNGGVYVTWIRYTTTDIPLNWHTEMIRLDSTCSPYANWNSGNVYDVTNMDNTYSDLQTIMSSDGHPIVAYLSAASSDYEVFKVDSTLNVATSVLSQVNVSVDNFKMVPDNAGGFVTGYLNTAGDTLYTRLFNSFFAPYDFGGGVFEKQIRNSSTGIESFHMTSNGTGGAYFAWNEFDPTLTYLVIYAEGIASNGDLWNSGTPIQLTPSDSLSYLDVEIPIPGNTISPMIPDGNNGFFLGFASRFGGSSIPAVQHVLSDKTLNYDSTGYLLSALSSSLNVPAIVYDGAGKVMTVFKDEGTQIDVYAQYVGTATPLTVTSVDPSSGIITGNTDVTILGTNFINITNVTFDGTPCTNIITVNDTTITCDTPAGTGTVDVVVTSSTNGSDTLTNGYEYLSGAYTVSGAGSNEVNGTYLEGGTFNGQPYYQNGSYYLYYSGTQYIIDNDGDNTDYYYANQDADTDPLGVYITGSLGLEPPPTVNEFTEGGGGGCDGSGPENEQCGEITVGCPAYTGADLVFRSAPSKTTFNSVVAGVDTDTYDSSAVSGSNLPGGNSSGNDVTGTPIATDHLLRITDTTSKGIDNCGSNGWSVTASISSDINFGSGKGLANTSTGQSGQYHAVDAQNIYLVTTNNVDLTGITSPEIPQAQSGPALYARYNSSTTGNPDNVTSLYETTGNVWSNITDYSTNGTSLETASEILTTGCNATLANGHNSDIYTGVGLAIDNGIDALQASGIYRGTITYTLAELVC